MADHLCKLERVIRDLNFPPARICSVLELTHPPTPGISPDSAVNGHIRVNTEGFTEYLQIKVALDKDRANLRWADVNGDGADDMLWIEKFSGVSFILPLSQSWLYVTRDKINRPFLLDYHIEN